MEQEFDLQNYFVILRRRFLFLVIPIILVCGGGVIVAYSLPPQFAASATILVESQQIPTDLASPTVTTNAAERINVIEQRLLTRENLLQIASKFDLYDYQGNSRSPSTIVDDMRSAVTIEQLDVNNRGTRSGAVIGFTVTFKYRDATTSSRVANELVSSILSQNIESRLSRASDTSKFFVQQQRDIEQRLLAMENKIADFKRVNELELPETLPDRRNQLAQLAVQLTDTDQRIRAARLPGTFASTDAAGANLQQTSFSLQAKQLQLDSLNEQRDEIVPLVEKGVIPKNRLRDLDQSIALAELNIQSLNAQIAAQGGAANGADLLTLLQSQRDDLNQQMTAISDSISKTPVVEVALNALNRDYENLQAEYRQAQAKLEDAQTGERLEQDRQAERFEVIDQATVPDHPSEPNRPRIILTGSFGGIAAGIGLVILLEMLDKSIHTAAQLEKKLQIRAIATIPLIATPGELRRKRWHLLAFFMAAVLAIALLLLAANTYYMPLDILFEKVRQALNAWLTSRFGAAAPQN